jgi:aryl-alcohol dehydrogenase-like predicted oxidoreductase
MRTTTLGTHGPEVGVVGLGAMGMSFAYDMATPRDEATSVSVIHQALDLGKTLIDTADVYGPYTNEELVGRALADRRDRAVIATKVGMECIDPTGGPGGAPLVRPNGRPEHVRAAIDASLRRLGTDHIDLYQLHRVDPEVPILPRPGAVRRVGPAEGSGPPGRLRLPARRKPVLESARAVGAVWAHGKPTARHHDVPGSGPRSVTASRDFAPAVPTDPSSALRG